MITIRTCAVEDASELTVLSQQLGYAISGQQTIQNIMALKESRNDEVFVAVHQQRVIGWIGVSFRMSLESAPSCEVHGVVVDEQFRGRGIGKMLIEKAKQWTTGRGLSKLRLRCNLQRTESLLFYKKIGFAEVKQQQVLEIKCN